MGSSFDPTLKGSRLPIDKHHADPSYRVDRQTSCRSQRSRACTSKGGRWTLYFPAHRTTKKTTVCDLQRWHYGHFGETIGIYLQRCVGKRYFSTSRAHVPVTKTVRRE